MFAFKEIQILGRLWWCRNLSKDGGGRMKDEKNLKVRTKEFALGIIRLYSELPRRKDALVLGDQLLRSGTSVGAHYHEAQRAKSDADFISKIEGALQELEETGYWLELLEESKLVSDEKLHLLKQEVSQLLAIFVSMVRRVKSRNKSREI